MIMRPSLDLLIKNYKYKFICITLVYPLTY